MAPFCSSVSTPAGTWSSTNGAPNAAVDVSAAAAPIPAAAPAATVAVLRMVLRLNPPRLSGKSAPSVVRARPFDPSITLIGQPHDAERPEHRTIPDRGHWFAR